MQPPVRSLQTSQLFQSLKRRSVTDPKQNPHAEGAALRRTVSQWATLKAMFPPSKSLGKEALRRRTQESRRILEIHSRYNNVRGLEVRRHLHAEDRRCLNHNLRLFVNVPHGERLAANVTTVKGLSPGNVSSTRKDIHRTNSR